MADPMDAGALWKGAEAIGSHPNGGTIFRLADGSTVVANGNSIGPHDAGPSDAGPADAGAAQPPVEAVPSSQEAGSDQAGPPEVVSRATPQDNSLDAGAAATADQKAAQDANLAQLHKEWQAKRAAGPEGEGSWDAFKGAVMGDAPDMSTTKHPDAALAGNLVNSAGHQALRLATPGATMSTMGDRAVNAIAKHAPGAVAGAMRTVAPLANMVEPGYGTALNTAADAVSPPVTANGAKPAANQANAAPGKAADATGTPAAGQGSAGQGAGQGGATKGTGKGSGVRKGGAGQGDEYTKQQKQEDDAIDAAADAEKKANDATLKQSNSNIDEAQILHDQQTAAEKVRQAENVTYKTELDKLNDEISKLKVDTDGPNSWMGSRSGGQKVSGAISMFLGGMASGFGVKSEGPQMIENAIQQNLDAQKANIANARAGVEMKNNIYKHFLDLSHGDARAAEAGARAAMSEFAKDKLAAVALETKDPLIKAQAMAGHALVTKNIIKDQHEWANTRTQMSLRYAETQGKQLDNQDKALDMVAKQKAIAANGGMPLAGKGGQVNPVYFPGEAAPRLVQGGPEAQKAALSTAEATNATLKSVDSLKKIVKESPWSSLISGSGANKDMNVELERIISNMYAARGKSLQPGQVMQEIQQQGLSPSLFSSTDAYLKRLEQYKKDSMSEANDIIHGYTGVKYYPEGPTDFQPGALK